MGQWYKATITPPTDIKLREKVEMILGYVSFGWEGNVQSGENFIWLFGNEYVDWSLKDVLYEIESHLNIPELKCEIHLNDIKWIEMVESLNYSDSFPITEKQWKELTFLNKQNEESI